MNKVILRADFYDDSASMSPFRSVIISAANEEEAVDWAAAHIGNAARIEFTHEIDIN
jgi:hypothetical protein